MSGTAGKDDSSKAAVSKADWFREAFNTDYLDLYAHRNVEDARRALGFIKQKVPLGDRSRLLDLCCGSGRHLSHLAPLAGWSCGIDLSRPLLARAQSTLGRPAESGPGGYALVEADMRRLPLADESFDLAVNLFTSFGYFEDDSENARVVAEVARVLTPGAYFVIDHINRSQLEKTLVAESERKLDSGARVVEARRFDAETSRILKDVEWISASGQSRAWNESVRVYTPGQMRAMLEGAGFENLRFSGTFEDTEFTDDSPRMIAVCRLGS